MRLLVVALVALTAAIAPASAGATSVAGPNGKILFTSGRANTDQLNPPVGNDDNARLWVADGPFGTPVQITTGPLGIQHRHPDWSPDHSKIVYAAGVAFSGKYAIRIKDLKANNDYELIPAPGAATPSQDRPTFSPDGTKIVVGGAAGLVLKGLNPGDPAVPITNVATDQRAVWSPDGNILYFNRGAAGNRDLERITPVAPGGTVTAVLDDATDDWQPELSPDGSKLCFLRGPQSDGADIFVVSVVPTVGLAAGFAQNPTLGDLNCVWSPDGTKILYTLGQFQTGDLMMRNSVNGGSPTGLPAVSSADHFDGNSDWATNFSATCTSATNEVAVNNFVSIPLACVDPDFGFGAAPPAPDPLGAGSMEIVNPPANGNVGSIGNDERIFYTPNLNFKGTDKFTYRASDGNSDGPPATITINVGTTAGGKDTTKPSLSSLKLKRKTFRRGTAKPKLSTAKGTTISFKLSEIAKVKFSFAKPASGRKVGRSCKKPSRKNASKRRCTRYVAAGSFTVQGRKGSQKVAFSGRLSARKRLALGRYKLTLTPTDGSGNKGKARSVNIRIVAR